MNDYPTPADRIVIRDLETLKVLSSPLRVQIMRELYTPKTVTGLSEAIDFPRTKLYYHVNLLEKHGLIQAIDTHVVSGIIEKIYQVTGYRIDVDNELILGAYEESIEEVLSCIFDGSRAEVLRTIEAGLIHVQNDERKPKIHLLSRMMVRLTPEQFASYRERLLAIRAELEEIAMQQQDTPEDARPVGFTIAYYPIAKLHFDEDEKDG